MNLRSVSQSFNKRNAYSLLEKTAVVSTETAVVSVVVFWLGRILRYSPCTSRNGLVVSVAVSSVFSRCFSQPLPKKGQKNHLKFLGVKIVLIIGSSITSAKLLKKGVSLVFKDTIKVSLVFKDAIKVGSIHTLALLVKELWPWAQEQYTLRVAKKEVPDNKLDAVRADLLTLEQENRLACMVINRVPFANDLSKLVNLSLSSRKDPAIRLDLETLKSLESSRSKLGSYIQCPLFSQCVKEGTVYDILSQNLACLAIKVLYFGNYRKHMDGFISIVLNGLIHKRESLNGFSRNTKIREEETEEILNQIRYLVLELLKILHELEQDSGNKNAIQLAQTNHNNPDYLDKIISDWFATEKLKNRYFIVISAARELLGVQKGLCKTGLEETIRKCEKIVDHRKTRHSSSKDTSTADDLNALIRNRMISFKNETFRNVVTATVVNDQGKDQQSVHTVNFYAKKLSCLRMEGADSNDRNVGCALTHVPSDQVKKLFCDKYQQDIPAYVQNLISYPPQGDTDEEIRETFQLLLAQGLVSAANKEGIVLDLNRAKTLTNSILYNEDDGYSVRGETVGLMLLYLGNHIRLEDKSPLKDTLERIKLVLVMGGMLPVVD